MEELVGFAAVLLIASISSLIFRRLKIASIAAYILTGLIVGPFFGIVNPSSSAIQFLSNLGIALIAFQIGLSIKMDIIERYGLKILMISILELISISSLLSMFGIMVGLSGTYIFVLIIVTVNSSTIVAFKFLEGKKAQNPHLMELLVGIGLAEDIIAMAGISMIPAIATLEKLMIEETFFIIGNIIVIAMGILVFGLQILPKLIKIIIKEGDIETVLLLIIAVALGFGLLGGFLGLSFAFGSFLAGVIISRLEIPRIVIEKLISLRDLFAIIFFISIGLSIPRIEQYQLIPFGIAYSLIIVLTRFISILSAGWMSLGIEQAIKLTIYGITISEFALIVAKDAYGFGLIDQTLFVTSALVVLISTIISSIVVNREENVIIKINSIIPIQLRQNMDRFAFNLRSWLKKLIISYELRPILISLSKKLASLIGITTCGSIIIQKIIEVFGLMESAIFISLMITIGLFAFSIIVLSTIRGDLDNIVALYRGGFKIIKNSIYIFIFMIMSIIVVLNSILIIRRIIESYLNIGEFVTLILISLFLPTIVYITYNMIKKISLTP
ncbi:MAG: cation:proton antiporter [Candidatus Methanomethyliaceae archaeon]|nr:cation:proton antiporter [Candidatus Methanomethyliaceae archaeon]MDW7970540.1 cation:proton antiporter [Nitrososphaerota archaeon]